MIYKGRQCLIHEIVPKGDAIAFKVFTETAAERSPIRGRDAIRFLHGLRKNLRASVFVSDTAPAPVRQPSTKSRQSTGTGTRRREAELGLEDSPLAKRSNASEMGPAGNSTPRVLHRSACSLC